MGSMVTTTAALERRDLTGEALTAAEMRARVNRIQEVMRSVMREGVHYGVIPGTDKPTLYKPGAEVILMTFRIGTKIERIEDLSIPGEEVRYRVIVAGINQATGEVLGEGAGECSSSEEKYKWRRPVHPKEFDASPDDRKRLKWTRSGETWQQVRTEVADVANTVLKMAVKRALVAMTLVVTAASDVFSQDIEDLPEELRDSLTSDRAEPTRQPPIHPPQRRSQGQTAANGQAAAPSATADPLTVTGVDSKSGESNGKKWTVYLVHLSDGRTASTFSESLATVARSCAEDKVAVDVLMEPGKKAGTWNLVELARLRERGGDNA